jgi:hypothetical protein
MKKVAKYEEGKKKRAQEKGRQPLFKRSYLQAAKLGKQQHAETQTVAQPKPFNSEKRLSKMPFYGLSNEELVEAAPKEASKVAEAEAGYCTVM